MKPPSFTYYSPTSRQEAHQLLAQYGEEGKILAGGQSLMPLLNMRMVRPSVLIDINRVPELDTIGSDGDALLLGALVRQQDLLTDARVAEQYPLLVEATRYIGHRTIRNRGTVGGSLAHSDPSAELPAVMVAVGAEIGVSSVQGERTIPAREFFLDYLTTALEPAELLVHVRIPPLASRTGWAFQEVSRRAGDFALVAAAALVTLDGSGVCQDAGLVLTGVEAVPHEIDLGRTLIGERPSTSAIAAAGELAGSQIDPSSDVHADADYRRLLARVLARRTLTTATERAGGSM